MHVTEQEYARRMYRDAMELLAASRAASRATPLPRSDATTPEH
jgi:hypothetical protein